MGDPMTRPLNAWGPESYHGRYYPQERPSPGVRLPPPSSLVTGRYPANSQEIASKQSSYPDHYVTTSAYSHRAAPQLPTPTSEPYAASTLINRYREDRPPRMSPGNLSATGDRSEEMSESLRLRQLVREQSSSQLPRIHPPTRPHTEFPPESLRAYPDPHQVRPNPAYRNRDVRHEQSPQTTTPPNTVWSPRSDTRPPERMKISDLLSGEPRPSSRSLSKAPMAPSPSPTASIGRQQYSITVRQQPAAARSCGFGERDRRVIDPPPIVQLKIDDPSVTPEERGERFRSLFAVMHCTIWSENGDVDCSLMPEDYRQQRRLMGSLVASSFVGTDENGEEGSFFCFPDLSCRTPGSFRLKFSLLILDPTNHVPGSKHPVRAEAMSSVFTVYNAKDFPGMQASTPLTKRLKEQGCLISIKKGNEKGGSKNDRDESDDDYDDHDDGGSSGGRRKKHRKS
ncbi:hypothetical protein JX265_007510 [Neoarthrinium moseri]|uniref:Velvet domain-containing protein n=1 Tax=Neoarthrinium moseri TaxID=1658444 RepID=A0A9P9WJM4_9PEZI|nr:hypothetical protein JX265_007510 [Neoarthrinium moseri]